MSKGKGLPPKSRMRADAHFVDHITAARPAAVGRMVEIDQITPNPTQPRREMAGIDELAESVREKGILEPLLVRPQDEGRYEIIAGERRYHAARKVGLTNVPCIEVDVDDQGCLEISLIENLQRRDLTPFEESEAISRLVDDFSYTHEQIARKLGRSRTVITEILSLQRMPAAVVTACRRADITTKSTLMEIVRQPNEEAMLALVEAVASGNLSRDEVRELSKSTATGRAPSRAKPFVFRYKPENRGFSLALRFDDEKEVEPRELLTTLEEIVKDLKDQIASDES